MQLVVTFCCDYIFSITDIRLTPHLDNDDLFLCLAVLATAVFSTSAVCSMQNYYLR